MLLGTITKLLKKENGKKTPDIWMSVCSAGSHLTESKDQSYPQEVCDWQ